MKREKSIRRAAVVFILVLCVALSARADADYMTCKGRIQNVQFACYVASPSICLQLSAQDYSMTCMGTKIVILHDDGQDR